MQDRTLYLLAENAALRKAVERLSLQMAALLKTNERQSSENATLQTYVTLLESRAAACEARQAGHKASVDGASWLWYHLERVFKLLKLWKG